MDKYLLLWSIIERTDSLGMVLATEVSERTRRDFHELFDSLDEARDKEKTLALDDKVTKSTILKVLEIP